MLLRWRTELIATPPGGAPTAEQQAQVAQWTDLARQDLEARRLVEPPGENAVARLKAIRSLDPDNSFAREQLDNLGQFFHDESRAAFVQGDVRTGVQKLEQGLLISPEHPSLLALREEVRARMDKPE